MVVSRVGDTDMENTVIQKGLKLASYAALLAAAKVITVDYPPVLILDPGGATEDVTLPAEALSKGLMFFIINTGSVTEILVIKNDAAATVLTIAQPENGFVYCDGVTWHGFLSPGIT